MAIDEADVIDLVMTDSEQRPILVAVDDGSIIEPVARLQALTKKLEVYASYVASGAFAMEHPDMNCHEVSFVVACTVTPTPEMERIEQISSNGRQFAVRFDRMPMEIDQEDQFVVSETMQQHAQEAFGIVDQYLEETTDFTFIWCLQNEKKRLVPVSVVTENAQPLDIARKWHAAKGENVECLVIVCRAQINDDDLCNDVAIAHCFERGHSKGFVLTKRLQQNSATGRLEAKGEIEFMTRIPNDVLE